MKFLLICPQYKPNNAVSVLRNEFFCNNLKRNGHEVEIWSSDLNSNLKSDVNRIIPNKLVSSFRSIITKKKEIDNFVKNNLKNYDYVIVSVPEFTLLSFVSAFKAHNIKVICDFRDQPDMIFHHYRKINKLSVLYRYPFLKMIELYMLRCAKLASFNICVGEVSKEILLKKGVRNVLNVHNGFLSSDLHFLDHTQSETAIRKKVIKIGCGGNIHDFRDSEQLRFFLKTLDEINFNSHVTVEFCHFGSFSSSLKKYITSLNSFKYSKMERMDRSDYLKSLAKLDINLLITSDCLTWEPTTTVFDYIINRKPIIYIGKAREAENILKDVGVSYLNANFLDYESVLEYFLSLHEPVKIDEELLLKYSREFQFEKFITKVAKF